MSSLTTELKHLIFHATQTEFEEVTPTLGLEQCSLLHESIFEIGAEIHMEDRSDRRLPFLSAKLAFLEEHGLAF